MGKKKKSRKAPQKVRQYDTSKLDEPCFQCELDIAHSCFQGISRAKWGVES